MNEISNKYIILFHEVHPITIVHEFTNSGMVSDNCSEITLTRTSYALHNHLNFARGILNEANRAFTKLL